MTIDVDNQIAAKALVNVQEYPHLTDQTGNQIKVGTILAYPLRRGSSMWHNFGIVAELIDNGDNEVSLKLMGVGEITVPELGTIYRERAVELNNWHRAIIIRPEDVNVATVANPSLLYCVHKWYEAQEEVVGQQYVLG